MLSSLGENIIFADADGSTDFEALNRFEKYTEKGTGDVLICGSRCHLKSDTESIVKVTINLCTCIYTSPYSDPFLDYIL